MFARRVFASLGRPRQSGDRSVWVRFTLLMELTLAAAFLGGCSRSTGPEMVVVRGTVTYQGKPIEDGEICFVPLGDTKGPTSSASIRNGHYEVLARGGVPVGTHRVEFSAFRIIPNPAPDTRGAAPGEPPKEQCLPEKYNARSELKVTIEPGQRKMTRDFNLGGQ
jgi:hypothetical protein